MAKCAYALRNVVVFEYSHKASLRESAAWQGLGFRERTRSDLSSPLLGTSSLQRGASSWSRSMVDQYLMSEPDARLTSSRLYLDSEFTAFPRLPEFERAAKLIGRRSRVVKIPIRSKVACTVSLQSIHTSGLGRKPMTTEYLQPLQRHVGPVGFGHFNTRKSNAVMLGKTDITLPEEHQNSVLEHDTALLAGAMHRWSHRHTHFAVEHRISRIGKRVSCTITSSILNITRDHLGSSSRVHLFSPYRKKNEDPRTLSSRPCSVRIYTQSLHAEF